MGNKIILNFIFKNEEMVLPQMLESCSTIIDAIVALDTGSNDNSVQIIKDFAEQKNIPFIVKYSDFTNFGENRNQVLDMAYIFAKSEDFDLKTTYIYWMDCDEILNIDERFNKNKLSSKSYNIKMSYGNSTYTRNALIRMDCDFKWIGPVHEFIEINEHHKSMPFLVNNVYQLGASWMGDKKMKFTNHGEILFNEFGKNPNDKYAQRWLFYAAQSFFDAATIDTSNIDFKLLTRAQNLYSLRCIGGGYKDEKYWSKYRLGIISNLLADNIDTTKRLLIEAFNYDNRRIESLYYLVELLMSMGQYNEAKIYASYIYHEHKTPPNLLFVNVKLYDSIKIVYKGLK